MMIFQLSFVSVAYPLKTLNQYISVKIIEFAFSLSLVLAHVLYHFWLCQVEDP